MKLDSAIPQAEPSLTEKEFLQMENQFLQDELEFQELSHSLELIETIKDCIRKEGGVSSSLEIMFGENWSDKSVALKDLEKAEEGLLDTVNNFLRDKTREKTSELLYNKLRAMVDEMKKQDLHDLKYPFDVLTGDLCYRGGNSGLAKMLSMITNLDDSEAIESFKENVAFYKDTYENPSGTYLQTETITNASDCKIHLGSLSYTLGNYERRFSEFVFNKIKKKANELFGSDDTPEMRLFKRVFFASRRMMLMTMSRMIKSIYPHICGRNAKKD